jgi:FtsP/CotA-like multicopper oxidase with cupredoxin domain
MKFVQIAKGGGLLPKPIIRNSFEAWPAMRTEVIVDFTRFQDGTPTRKGDVIYLTNICKMTDGRVPDKSTRFGGVDPSYKVPILKFVIGDDAPDDSLMPAVTTTLRPAPPINPNWKNLRRRRFRLERGGLGGEIQWLINGHIFEPDAPLASVKRGAEEVWILENGGGGWVHPMHLHQEEFMVLQRNGRRAPDAGHPDDTGKDDVVALDPGEEVWVYRKFRSFVGNYVAHCHNLAHEDHAMMFGWKIIP